MTTEKRFIFITMEIKDIFPRWTSNYFVSRFTPSLSAQAVLALAAQGSTVSVATDTDKGTGNPAARHGRSKT